MSNSRSSVSRMSGRGPVALFVCDVQERFRELINGFDQVIATSRFLMDAAAPMELHVVVTEQYPKAFGHTVPELQVNDDQAIAKSLFSMITPEVSELLEQKNIEHVAIVGIEAHVCVLQTCCDLLDRNIRVSIICDGVSSQSAHDRLVALHRMQSEGANLSTAESFLFQLLRTADNPKFKEVAKIIRQRKRVEYSFGGVSNL